MSTPQTVVITGASAGIGRALAFAFAQHGYRLGLTSRRLPVLEDLREEIRGTHPDATVEVAALDVDETETVQPTMAELFERLDGVDIVVVNAGINDRTPVGRGNLAQELQILQTNLLGAVATVDAAARYFRGKKRGQIVGISSLAALGPIPTQAAYCASKAGFSMYLDAARLELSRHGISVTTILPGFVKTEIVSGMEKYPFVVSAEKAAAEMVGIIERRVDRGIVPAFPWKVLRPFLGMVPNSIWARFK